jgi:hypothetical protein
VTVVSWEVVMVFAPMAPMVYLALFGVEVVVNPVISKVSLTARNCRM